MINSSQSKRSTRSKDSRKSQTFKISSSIRLHLLYGSATTLRKASCASSLAVFPRSSRSPAAAGSVERSTSCSAVTLQPQNLNFCSTFTKSRQEAFTLQAREVPQLVSQSISQETQKPVSLSLRVAPLSSLTEASVASMSSTRWTITRV